MPDQLGIDPRVALHHAEQSRLVRGKDQGRIPAIEVFLEPDALPGDESLGDPLRAGGDVVAVDRPLRLEVEVVQRVLGPAVP